MRTICGIIKDEHDYLKEWIDYHLGIGFDSIHLFEDKDSKSHENIVKNYNNVYLRRYETDNEVQTLLEAQGNCSRQKTLYSWFADNYKDKYDWVAFIDLDEFVFFSNDYNLDKLCEEFKEYPAVLLNWKMIGANKRICHTYSNIIDSYHEECGFSGNDKQYAHKSFVNLKKYKGFSTHHKAIDSVNTNHTKNSDELFYDKCWLNHYFTKSWEDWCTRIFQRGGTLNGHRTLNLFFNYNKNMNNIQKKLMDSVSHNIPNGTYYIDKENGLIAGGNVKEITELNNKTSKLIFDLGFYNGDTSKVFLKKGYKVVGVECNPNLKLENEQNYLDYIINDKLILIDKCISDKDDEQISFYLSKFPIWNSTNINIAERKEKSKEIKVLTTTLKSLIETYGCPDYCKIDIEGNDVLAVRSLKDLKQIPKYISVETECLGKDEKVKINMIDELHNVGYTKFLFVNQKLINNFTFDFNNQYDWIDYHQAQESLKDLQQLNWDYGVWADLYATY